ncbi:hypothetical protein [Nocardioides aurantiacus]|uniref:Uncharacterized protein n=1 Tax=Nocardioides aurantiacus TaxID=86796 RepID=A0A3N2CW41_9ACTN|nr:hypothetical protein [Nocardioides aurantiacus]ROR91775.1 hypothetical protein EDD33_2650 [Nocardioides aurantiacus]
MAVRRESVVLDLETNFPPEAVKAAAAIQMLNDKVKGLNKGAVESSRANQQLAKSVDEVGRSTQRSGKEIDQFSGRLKLIAQAVAVLGPGLVPIGAVGIPAISGLAASMGFAAIAGGTMIAAFQGVGDALKAANEAAINPTAENLDKAREAMSAISPEAQGFVRQIREMAPALKGLRDTAAAGMFPGFVEGLREIETALPKVERIIAAVSGELGDIAADAGGSLAGPRWAEFFDFLATDSAPALRQMATGVGNIAHAMAELWMAFDPLNDDFGSFLVNTTGKLDDWASSLSETQGFADFINYVRTTGPQVAETFGAIANMVVQIVQAAAPLGGPVLAGLEAVANVIASIADSDLGTPIFTALAALALYNRALQATAALSKTAFFGGGTKAPVTGVPAAPTRRQQLTTMRSDYGAARASQAQTRATTSGMVPIPLLKQGTVESDRLRTSLTGMGAAAGKAGALVGGLALASSGAADSIGVTNTVSLGLLGTMAGPWGAAIGTTAGAMMDLRAASDDVRDAITRANAAMSDMDVSGMAASYDQITAKQREWSKSMNDPINNPFDIGAIQARATMLMSLLDGTARAAEKAKRELAGSMNAGAALGAAGSILQSQGLLAKGMNLTADSAKKQAAALAAARTAANSTGAAFTGLGADVNNAEVSLNGWLRSLEQQNAALQGFATNSIRAANRGLRDGLIKQLQAAGPEGAMRLKQLANATDREIGRANRTFVRGKQAVDQYGDAVERNMTGSAGKVERFSGAIKSLPKKVQTEIRQNGLERTRSAVVDLTRRYNLTPRQIRTLIREQGGAGTKRQVDAVIASARLLDRQNPRPRLSVLDQASRAIFGVRAELNSLNGRVATSTIRINTLRTTTFSVGGMRASADGGSVPKTGMPYADRHHYLLADGEEVISNRYGQADRHRDLLKAINANRLADGGTALDAVKSSIASANRGGAYYGSGSSSSAPSLSGLRISGQLMTPFGPADIEGMIVDAIADDREMTSMVERTAPAYGGY